MSVDAERVNRYLLEIRSRHREISVLLKENADEKSCRTLGCSKG
jgi:hypothetical protein